MATILFRYFPLFSFLITVVPSLFNKQWYKSLPGVDQETEIQYKRAYWGYIIIWAIVWAPMIIGIFIGNVPTMLHFFVRGSGNPYINAYWIIQIMHIIAGFIWIFFFNGANFLINYFLPMTYARRSRSMSFTPTPLVIKSFFLIGLMLFILILFFGLPDDFSVINDMLSAAP